MYLHQRKVGVCGVFTDVDVSRDGSCFFLFPIHFIFLAKRLTNNQDALHSQQPTTYLAVGGRSMSGSHAPVTARDIFTPAMEDFFIRPQLFFWRLLPHLPPSYNFP